VGLRFWVLVGVVARGVMEALVPTPVAHSGMLCSHPQPKNVVVGSKIGPVLRQSEVVAGLDLRGAFRKQQRGVFVGRDVRVRGGRWRQLERTAVEVSAIDAAQPFDYESKKSQELEKSSKLKVGIVGFGNFGQFLAERIVKQGHRVLAHSRRDYSGKARELGVAFFRSVGIAFLIVLQ
jgi:hypothetical protein